LEQEPLIIEEQTIYVEPISVDVPISTLEQRHENIYVDKTSMPKQDTHTRQEVHIEDVTTITYLDESMLIPHRISAASGEVSIKQYHIANMRNLFRFTRAYGQLEVTSKRLILKAEKHSFGRTTGVQKEHSINNITGLDIVSGNRLSITRLIIGLTTIGIVAAFFTWIVLWFTYGPLFSDVSMISEIPYIWMVIPRAIEGLREGWGQTISAYSIIFGLITGFGGLVLFFILREKYWLKQILLGMSLGGFSAVSLSYGVYAIILLSISAVVALVGLLLFAWLSELCVTVHSRDGISVCMVRGRRITDTLHGAAGAAYAEAAPGRDVDIAVRELGAIISDIQNLGLDGINKWRE